MKNILPGFSSSKYSTMDSEELVIYAVEHYLLILLYTLLFVLVNMNIWSILIKQSKYQNLPLTVFYVFAFMTILFRLIYLIFCFTSVKLVIVSFMEAITKFCVGALQTWMICEITLRVKNHDVSLEREKKLLKRIKVGQVMVFIACAVLLIASTIKASITLIRYDEN